MPRHSRLPPASRSPASWSRSRRCAGARSASPPNRRGSQPDIEGRGVPPLSAPLSAGKVVASRHRQMVPGDSSGLLPDMPNGLTYMLMRPLISPLALVALGLGFVIWRFMGDIPWVLSMGLEVLVDGLRHGGPRPSPNAELTIAFPVDAGPDAMRAVDPSFSATSFLAEVQRSGERGVAGWASRNLQECRILMTDSCWIRQAAQLARPAGSRWRPFALSSDFKTQSLLPARNEPRPYP